MSDLVQLLIIDCTFDSNGKSSNCVKDICSNMNLTKQIDGYESIPFHSNWNLTNKYFNANIKVCISKEFQIEKVNKGYIEAVIILFNLDQENEFIKIKEVSNTLKSGCLEVSILVNINEQTSGSKYDDVFQWCIDNNFELVQIHDKTEEDEEDEFPEKVGIDRIIEALRSHVWSNHILHEENDNVRKPNLKSNTKEQKTDEQGDIENMQTFEELFGNFEKMKEKAQTLHSDDRKEYAEKVTLAFMEALGIDDEDS